MKKLILVSLAALSVASCTAPATGAGGGVDAAEFEALKKDVERLKKDIYGLELANCDSSKVLNGITAYDATMKDLPDAELEAADWHKAIGERDDVMTTPSGLQYIVVQEGVDGPNPRDTDIISVNYHGTFIDGKIFDSSYQRGTPLEFQTNGVIKGWIEAMKGMKPCEARTLFIPGDLAYGPNGRGSIPPNATLIFNVQLLGIKETKGILDK